MPLNTSATAAAVALAAAATIAILSLRPHRTRQTPRHSSVHRPISRLPLHRRLCIRLWLRLFRADIERRALAYLSQDDAPTTQSFSIVEQPYDASVPSVYHRPSPSPPSPPPAPPSPDTDIGTLRTTAPPTAVSGAASNHTSVAKVFFQRGDGRLLCCIRTAGDATRNPIWDTFGGILTDADIHSPYTTNDADTNPHALAACARRLLESQVDLPGSWTLAMEAAFEAHPSGNHHCVEQSSNEGRPITVVTWVVPVPHESHGPRLHNFGPHAGAPCTVGEDALMGAHHPGEPCCLEWYPAAAILERMSGSTLLALTTSSMRTSLAVPLPERQPAQQQAQVGPPEPPQSAAVSLPSPGGAHLVM